MKKIVYKRSDKWRQYYHLMPETGWMSDPNGLCQLKGTYHIFFQYIPDNPISGKVCWGHYSTKNFINYIQEDIAIFPDSDIDRDGAYSGGAFVKNDKAYFFYTGNIRFKGNYDYIYSGRGHFVNMFTSDDGIQFSQKVNLLKNVDYPSDMSCHVRDPKIYEEKGNYYMVLGARTKEDQSCVLIYKSSDLENWNYLKRISYDKYFGYMWECPNLFEIDGQKILIICPQGVKKDGFNYENVYLNGYCLLDGAIEDELVLKSFHELDKGFDFYAPQVFKDDKKRQILIGWLGLPDIPYANPTVQFGWQHCLTLPRELRFKDNKLYSYPIKEIELLFNDKQIIFMKKDREYKYQSQSGKICFKNTFKEFDLHIRKDVCLTYKDHIFTLSLGESGFGRDDRHVVIDTIRTIDIFSDISSLEIFINDGEYSMSTRVYDDLNDTYISCSHNIQVEYYQIRKINLSKRK